MSSPDSLSPTQPASRRYTVLSTTLAILLIAVLAGILAPQAGTETAAALALLIFLPTAWPQYGIKEIGLVLAAGVSAAVLIATATTADALATIMAALSNGANLVALILSLTFLRNAAASSPLVARTGRYLARQPPGRRYLAVSFGGHLFGLMLNFGVINLLGPVVRESASVGADASADDRRRALNRRRRMMTALIRGFSMVMVWSPATVGQAVLVTSIPGLIWIDLVPYTLSWVATVWALGWFQDRFAWRHSRRSNASAAPRIAPASIDDGNWRHLAGLCAITAGMLGMVVSLNAVAGLTLLQSVMIAAPGFAIGWLALQANAPLGMQAGRLSQTADRLRSTIRDDFPRQGREVALLGAAGFIGVALPAIMPPDILVGIVDPASLSQPVVGIAMMMTLIIGGLVGISPLIAVPVLGGLLASVPDAAINPVFAGLSLAAGWGLCNGSTPFSASAVLAGRFVDSGPETVVWRWNGAFTVLAAAVCALFLFAVSPLLPPT